MGGPDSIIASAPHAILVVRDHCIQFANQRAELLTGLPSEALLHRPLVDIVEPNDRAALVDLPRRPRTIRIISNTGEAHRVRCDAAPIKWEDQPATLLFFADLDVIGEDEQALESRFASLFDNINDAIFIHDFRGNFLEVNAVACNRLGYNREELLCLVIKDINAVDQSAKIPERLQRIQRDGHIVFETEHKRRDGTTFPVEINSRLYEFEGQPAILSVARDTSERRRLANEVIQAQKMESVGLLAGGLAHDFNNILGAILGLTSLLHQEIPTPDRSHTYLDLIETSVRRAADLTAQLLALARKSPPRSEQVDLNEVVSTTLGIVARTFDRKITIETNLASSLPAVRGDEGQLTQAVMNLCLNSRDAMPGGGKLTVSTEAKEFSESERALLPERAGDRGVVLSVTDTGSGITPEVQERMFEPFFTTKGPGKGTGLGLSTVHWVVQTHGGFYQVDSEAGRGATFRIFLPARGEAATPEVAVERQLDGRGELILVVDDDEILRLTCSEMLTRRGYGVLCAQDGIEACDLLSAHSDRIRLVLLDVIMPRMGGARCLAELRSIVPDIRAVLMSGYDPESEKVDAGVAGYLQKPFGPEQLAAAVRDALDAPP